MAKSAQQSKKLVIPENEILAFAIDHETPVYLYDEALIRSICKKLKASFNWAPGFKNYFAVKATPNPSILEILKDEGFGVDCSSMAELMLAELVGFSGNDIFFTSNNTPLDEYTKAKGLGAIINLDDVSHVEFIHETIGLPDLLCFRYNPGRSRTGNVIIGDPENSKFGMTKNQIFAAIEKSLNLGVKKFALHTMIISNCLNESEIFANAKMMFDLVVEIFEKTGVNVETVNCGGGFGIPYRPEDRDFDLDTLSRNMQEYFKGLLTRDGVKPFNIVFECGRYITGPAGMLVTRILHLKKSYKNFIGVDANMANLMRPALYNSYHHIVHIKDPNYGIINSKLKRSLSEQSQDGVYDVVGSLCENNDKLAIDRFIGHNVEIGDLLVILDAGAHGHCMGFNYNGKLRSAEYLKTSSSSGSLIEIRRRETLNDYFSTINYKCSK